ncbi:MAG: phage holin family protein [Clostridium sp.]|uniref:phage holin family protein n=1 Tax=Clostridium sp. TaxID=1506 RepID=UPI0025BEBDC7|nr:phage holin family protein [Clostridium sp.]MCH3963871.1 phage holin family protein [Clostridium sp.]MCI1716990.1 phage holin family protein [Clostridium sp.]MCI1801291.1 phage holin family protein [Clostridium sp.]MCI1815137.1 phage holin family protein [Clostridium sp.]MCI1872079.1 phage holin family protein [Clostridium sp.]
MNDTSDNKDNRERSSVGRYIIRLIITVIILAITSFLTPGFSIAGLWSYLAAAVVISIIDYLVEKFMGVDASPFGKGFKGFVIAAIILYLTQFIVPNMRVSIIGAIIAAIIIGILDAVLPSGVM